LLPGTYFLDFKSRDMNMNPAQLIITTVIQVEVSIAVFFLRYSADYNTEEL